MLDVLRLENLVIDCIVGMYPSERLRPQPLRVDLALHLDTRRVAQGAGLAGTVDYARLAGELRFLLISCQFLLLETAAEALCSYLLAPPTDDAPHAAVEEVTLKLTKPAALDGVIVPSLEVHRRAAEMSYSVEEKPFGHVDVVFETRTCGIYRLRIQPGGAIPTHEHRRTDESELVLGSGLHLQGEPVEAGTGFRWPRGASHRYDNPSTTWQTVLCVDRPSFEPSDEVVTDAFPLAPPQGMTFFSAGVAMSLLPVGMRKVLVTGASSGIGHAVVSALLERGSRVAGVARRSAQIDRRAVAIACDLADPAARQGLVERARVALGGLDGLVYAAGVVAHQLPGAIDEASLRAQLEIDLVAPLRLGEEALPLLDEGGAMVFVTSTLAERPIATSAVYSAAKAGLTAVSRSFALAGAPRGLRINDVSPGVIDTDMVRGRPAADVERLRRLHPLGRLGTPDEVASAVLYLLGAPFTTGTTLRVDGGILARE